MKKGSTYTLTYKGMPVGRPTFKQFDEFMTEHDLDQSDVMRIFGCCRATVNSWQGRSGSASKQLPVDKWLLLQLEFGEHARYAKRTK